jgi:hypothetical protein
MSNTHKPALKAHWFRETPSDRWRVVLTNAAALQSLDNFGWARRSAAICRWRAAPAAVSTLPVRG